MTQISYPFDSTDTTETQFSQLFKRLNSTGVWGSTSTTDLKVTGDSSGMQVKVAAGFALVRGHAYYNDAVVTLAIGATTTNPRWDLIVLKLDPTANTTTLVVKAGTAAASPADPTLTQDESWTGGIYEFPIGRVKVPAGTSTSITAGMVEDIRQFMGMPFGKWTTALRPVSPQVGQAGYNTTIPSPEYWDGSAWQTFVPAITASMISAGEQANIVAGKIRAGGTSGGAATTVFVQSATPTANANGDLWFW